MNHSVKHLSTSAFAVLLVIVIGPVQAQDTLPSNISCIGFDYPMSEPIAVPVNKRRMALPLRATLRDASNEIVIDSDLGLPPVVQVMYDSGVQGEIPVDQTDLLEWQDESISEDNYFVYMPESQEWHLSISARPYISIGTYTITMESGDETEYTFPDDYKCKVEFIRSR